MGTLQSPLVRGKTRYLSAVEAGQTNAYRTREETYTRSSGNTSMPLAARFTAPGSAREGPAVGEEVGRKRFEATGGEPGLRGMVGDEA